jgi:hypothetical protein
MDKSHEHVLRLFGTRLRELLAEFACDHSSELLDLAAAEVGLTTTWLNPFRERFGCACKLVAAADTKSKPAPAPNPYANRDALFADALRRSAKP